jgi:hypothetical protein
MRTWLQSIGERECQRIAALEAEIEQVERDEGALIRAGAAIDWRADASPAAVLGVRITKPIWRPARVGRVARR